MAAGGESLGGEMAAEAEATAFRCSVTVGRTEHWNGKGERRRSGQKEKRKKVQQRPADVGDVCGEGRWCVDRLDDVWLLGQRSGTEEGRNRGRGFGLGKHEGSGRKNVFGSFAN